MIYAIFFKNCILIRMHQCDDKNQVCELGPNNMHTNVCIAWLHRKHDVNKSTNVIHNDTMIYYWYILSCKQFNFLHFLFSPFKQISTWFMCSLFLFPIDASFAPFNDINVKMHLHLFIETQIVTYFLNLSSKQAVMVSAASSKTKT